jgi:hypothetical protein
MSLAQVLQVPFAPSRYAQPGGVLLQDLVSTTPQSSLGVVQDDQFVIQLFPRTLSNVIGGTSSTLQLSSGSSIIFGLKTVGGESLLDDATAFTEYTDGSGNWYYGSTLTLDGDAVAAALGDDPSVACIGEIRITDATGAVKRYQFYITLYAAVYLGDEGTISAPEPGTVLTFAAGSQAVASGVDFVTVTDLALSGAPALIIPQLVKADGTKANIGCFLRAGWTEEGFTVDLTAATPDDTYVLTWAIVNSNGSVGIVDLAEGDDSIEVPLTLTSAPTAIIPIVVKADGTKANIGCFLRAGWGPSGFTVDLTAAPPEASYQLYYLLIP